MGLLTKYKYSTVTGFFLQDDPNTGYEKFDYKKTHFGLISRKYETDQGYDPNSKKTQWQRFAHQVSKLNSKAPENVQYKLLLLARHGQGVHNVAEARYGREKWDCYWSKQAEDKHANWVNAPLTEQGMKQAEEAKEFWAKEIKEQMLPMPQTYYTSPLKRSLQTAKITFSELVDPFVPVVKERLREDRNQAEYPLFTIEPDFKEKDELWKPDVRETEGEQDARMQKLLDDVFSNDESTYISFSCHSLVIAALLRVLKHRPFRIPTGAVIPVLVKAETVDTKPGQKNRVPKSGPPNRKI